MNPFEEKGISLEDSIKDWCELYPKHYNKYEVNPYTKTRIILMNGTEFEANWFSHQFSRNCNNNDLRRAIAFTRRIEKQQQMKIAHLKPISENILETTISYEQLAVDLTARLAKSEPDPNVKAALDFALLEDFDHLYRYADLLDLEYGIAADKLVGRYTEIMPGRPTISHHRHPYDEIKNYINNKTADPITKLNVNIITAAEQQTMNFYMNVGQYYTSELGRRLYQEIGLVEEEHVSQYGSLIDPNGTWLENLLNHEYTECYLYYSMYLDETDEYIKKIWERFFLEEVTHLHIACELLQKYEGKSWQQIIPNGTFPTPLTLGPNIEYVRNILCNTSSYTAMRESYIPVCEAPKDFDFFTYQNIVNKDVCTVPSHIVINKYLKCNECDFRFEVAPNPVEALRNRKCDNVCVGREPLCGENCC